MAGIITTASHPKALWPGIKAWWGQVYDEHKEEYSQLFDSDTSSMNYEEDVQLTGFGLAPVKSEGSGVAYDSEIQGFTTRYTHVAYALGYIVTKEELDDNLYEQVSRRRAAALAMSFRQTKENVGANVYNRAFSGTYLGGDGSPLFSTTHATISGTFRNTLATAADLNETSLEQSLIDIAAFTDERGLKIAAQGVKLIIPSESQFTADRLMASAGRTGTADNDINAIRNKGMIPQGYVVNHYLTDSDAFFIMTDVPNGLKYFERSPIRTSMEGDFETGNVRYKARERYSFGFSDPRGAFGSPGA